MKNKFFYMGLLLMSAGIACADNGINLRINGNFHGSSLGADAAPGWSSEKTGGTSRIVPVTGKDECQLEIVTEKGSRSVFSDFQQVSGPSMKIELDYSGSGTAAVSCFFYDRQKQQICKESTSCLTLTGKKQKFKRLFQLPLGTAWVRIVLTAGENTKVRFGNLEAKIYVDPAKIPALPRIKVSAPPSAGKTSPAAIPPDAVQLYHEQKIFYINIPDQEKYRCNVMTGENFEFKLGEDSSRNFLWQVASCDRSKCKVNIEHEHKGVGVFNMDEAEIEIKPHVRGLHLLEFQCGNKHVTLYLNAQ